MKNILIFSDLHINSKELIECKAVLDEFHTLIAKYHIDALINAGDTFDNISPSSQELDIFSDFIKKANLPIIILAAQSHESTTPEQSILNHFGILNQNITVVKEFEDENYLYIGHFVLKESKYSYGATQSKYQFNKYKYVILEHQHDYETIPKNICHLGSCRRVDFSEDAKLPKKVAICLNYKTKDEKWLFPSLNSPYSLINIELATNSKNSDISRDVSEHNNRKENAFSYQYHSIAELISCLDKLDRYTKIRVIFNDYVLWREFLPYVDKYKDKFIVFREKKNFIIKLESLTSENKKSSFVDTLKEYLQINNVEEKIKQTLLDEIEEVRG